jgi:uncharacterized OsmC-like protein
MNADELRSIQAPLKDQYRQTPDAALVTLRAQGQLGENVSCKIDTGKALVACAGVTFNAVATALDIELRDALLQAEGDLDFRGTLGVSKEVPVGLQNIRLKFILDTDASDEQLETLIRLTERYCVVYQTLVRPPVMTITRLSLEG